MVNYFHDFYMHSFVLAKNWSEETSNLLPKQGFHLTTQTWDASSPWTPSAFLNLSSGPSSPEVPSVTNISNAATQLCRWSIHISTKSYSCVVEMEVTATPGSQPPPTSFVDSLNQSMTSNDFTTTPKEDLPLVQDMIMKSMEGDPSPLQVDAWKLAIMAGNRELLWHLWNDGDTPE